MELFAQRLHHVPNDRLFAQSALRRPSLRALRLTSKAPRIPIFLNVRHPLLEWIAALRAEEVPVVEVLAQCHDVFPNDGSRAMLTFRRKQLVPVQVAIKPQSVVTVVDLGLARDIFQKLAIRTACDAAEALFTLRCGLGTDFKVGEGRATGVTVEAVRVPSLREAGESNDSAFDRKLTRVTGGCRTRASWGPMAPWDGCWDTLAIRASERVLSGS